MATTVQKIFNAVGIFKFHQVKWGEVFAENKQGVYVVSLSRYPEQHLGLSDAPVFDEGKINLWLEKLPQMMIDGVAANADFLKKRLSHFWLKDESILYIGMAPSRKNDNGIGGRVREYYKTQIGDKGPHSGGQWIQVLSNINTLSVYYGYCDDPRATEYKMLEVFAKNASDQSMPFANLRFKGNKRHGLKNQRLKKRNNLN